MSIFLGVALKNKIPATNNDGLVLSQSLRGQAQEEPAGFTNEFFCFEPAKKRCVQTKMSCFIHET